jgi:Cytochrome P450
MLAPPLSILLTSTLGGWISYLFVLAIYRLYFHPLAKFPGPRMAALTSGYEFYYDAIKGGRYYKKIEKLHEKYGNYHAPFSLALSLFPSILGPNSLANKIGPIVRITPEQLHIKDSDFYDEIYTQKMDKEYSSANTVAQSSSFGTIGHNHHRLRRSALNQFFSKRSVAELELMISSKVEQLCQQLATALETKEVVQLDIAYLALAMDIVTDYSFGQPVGYLERKDFALEWNKVLRGYLPFLHFIKQAPWVHHILKSIPFFILNRISPGAAALARWQKVAQEQVNSSIENHHLGKNNQRSIFVELLDSDLPPEEKSADRLNDEAQVIIAAGSGPMAKALAVVTFHLLHDKTKLKKLRDELASVPFVRLENESLLTHLENLPYFVSYIR